MPLPCTKPAAKRMPAAPTTPPAEDEPQQKVARNDPGTAAVAAREIGTRDPGPDQGRASDPGPDQGHDPGPRFRRRRPLPYVKVVRHLETGNVELRAWWDVPCRNGPNCSSGLVSRCYFRHDIPAYQWLVIEEYHVIGRQTVGTTFYGRGCGTTFYARARVSFP